MSQSIDHPRQEGVAIMKHPLLIAGFAYFLATSFAVEAAGDAAAGKTKAAGCAGCHGANGEGVKPNPPLAGKSEAELVQALKDYKSGKRVNPIMKAMATPLSDSDMANVAAYYASLKAK
jgi:cytochrome c553